MPLEVANTILAQLGGNRFMAMTGARDFVGSDADHSLTFKLRLGARSTITGASVNWVRITLDAATDTYKMQFGYARGIGLTIHRTIDGVTWDALRQVFEINTGLRTSL